MSLDKENAPSTATNSALPATRSISLSKTGRNDKFRELVKNLREDQRKLLISEQILVAAIDNFQRTARLREQRVEAP